MIDMGLSSIVNPPLVIIMDYLSIKISLMEVHCLSYGLPTSADPTTLLDDSKMESDLNVKPIHATLCNVSMF